MPNPSKTIIAFPATTILTASANGSQIVLPDGFTSFIAYLNVTLVSGTSPTLNAVIQTGFRDIVGSASAQDQDTLPTQGTIVWDDFAAFAQATSTSKQVMRLTGGGNTVNAASPSGALTAGTIRNGPIGGYMRVRMVVAGTNPIFTGTYVVIQFIP